MADAKRVAIRTAKAMEAGLVVQGELGTKLDEVIKRLVRVERKVDEVIKLLKQQDG